MSVLRQLTHSREISFVLPAFVLVLQFPCCSLSPAQLKQLLWTLLAFSLGMSSGSDSPEENGLGKY